MSNQATLIWLALPLQMFRKLKALAGKPATHLIRSIRL